MTTPAWHRLRDAFDRVADAPPEERPALLAALRATDAALAADLEALLAASDEAFLSTPLIDVAGIGPTAPELGPGTRIGGYTILERIGQGGMGDVYSARIAEADFEKVVAIKVMRAPATNADAQERFTRERRILAQLDHRNIAQLHDGGVTADGRPFLVMEHVRGQPITVWCESHRLRLAQRLSLFRQVAGAVHHAHQRLVVHRDLKPGNILVTDDGTVKLLDFGIAKVLEGDGDDQQAVTMPDQQAVTPQYAAPEQLSGEPITTATDVYALGLLLFELCTGTRPFHRGGMSVVELVRAVMDDQPPMASRAVRGLAAPDAGRRAAALRGDLDAILARALAPAVADRYGSVAELLDDLRRHEEGLPVLAVRGRALYRLRKAASRHRVPLMALALVILVLVGGIVATGRQAARAERERRRAEETNAFLTSMLRAADPFEGDRDLTVVELLDRAATNMAESPPSDPAVEASLREAIGGTYAALGRFDPAEGHLRRALQLREQRPDERLALARALHELGSWHDGRSEYLVADSLFRRALAVLGDAGDPGALAERADLLHNQARMQSQLGDFARADTLITEVIAQRRQLHGPRSAEVGLSLAARGLMLLQHGELARAEAVFREALAIQQAAYGRDRPETAQTLSRLATALELQGHRPQADSAYRAALAMLTHLLGPEHPEVMWTHYNLAGFLLDGGEWTGALAEADRVLRHRGGTVPESQAPVSGSLQIRGLALAALGDAPGAFDALRESLALRRRHNPPGHWTIGSAESVLGEVLVRNGKEQEGIPLLRSGFTTVERALGPDHPQSRKARARLAEALAP